MDTPRNPASTDDPRDEVLRVPVVEELLDVGRRVVETGRVVVRKRVTEERVELERPLTETRVEVERVAVGRFVEEVPPTREEGDVLVIPVVEEVLVVEKRLMLKEEVRLSRRTTTRTHVQVETVRSERAEVDRVGGETEAVKGPGPSTDA